MNTFCSWLALLTNPPSLLSSLFAGGPPRPSGMSPTPGSRGRPKRQNFLPLFTIGTRLGELHVKMNIYDKRDGSVRINIYEPLSSKQYPMDLEAETMAAIVGKKYAGMMTEKTPEAKVMWKVRGE